jgi:hypothetical protein
MSVLAGNDTQLGQAFEVQSVVSVDAREIAADDEVPHGISLSGPAFGGKGPRATPVLFVVGNPRMPSSWYALDVAKHSGSATASRQVAVRQLAVATANCLHSSTFFISAILSQDQSLVNQFLALFCGPAISSKRNLQT